MDTSKKYLKMCEKAVEIQQLQSTSIIWMPRQDELQDMVWLGTATSIYYQLRHITEFQMKYSCQTMEQLWLAFVMKEKYNKTWNGEDWK